MASSEIYEELKDRLRYVLDELKLLTKQPDYRNANGETLQEHDKSTQRLCSQAHALIKDLENEVYQAPMSFRAGMNREIKRFKYDLDSIERNLEQRNPIHMRQATFGRGSSSSYSASPQEVSEQSTVLLGHKSLKRATDSIARSQMVSSENEAIGNNILNDLDTQREQLHRTRDRLEDTNVELTRSQKLLRSINRNVITNRIVLIGIIFLELVILGCVVYLRFFRNK
uniref:Vesicle transport through interaction with t-SNAREs homolog 1B-like n=1 Tax=Phallusia mammillata TaxID=59560 RepID=A0A6F9DW24_9ASCI|nr:vesicle transport through interaction with t-SNAREs homolog 1B-like [Phallusia mammillata]